MKKTSYILSLFVLTLVIPDVWGAENPEKFEIPIVERSFSGDPSKISIGIANKIT